MRMMRMKGMLGTRGRRLAGCAAGVAAVAALAGAAPAQAGTPTGIYAQFSECPRANPEVTSCVYSETTSGSFTLGNTTVPIEETIVLQGGTITDLETNTETFVHAVGARTLSDTELEVPGGLLGIMTPTGFGGPLLRAFEHAVATANGVTATAELVGEVGYSFNNYFNRDGAAVSLPVRVHLENPFLGPDCYIGSAGDPVTLNLTTGTTSPPPPNQPISGELGTFGFEDGGNLITATGYKLVDNSFSVSAAHGCGLTFLDRWLVTQAVNLKVGLPAASGENTAILGGDLAQANADAVRASEE